METFSLLLHCTVTNHKCFVSLGSLSLFVFIPEIRRYACQRKRTFRRILRASDLILHLSLVIVLQKIEEQSDALTSKALYKVRCGKSYFLRCTIVQKTLMHSHFLDIHTYARDNMTHLLSI